jgi:hypothetical protein
MNVFIGEVKKLREGVVAGTTSVVWCIFIFIFGLQVLFIAKED